MKMRMIAIWALVAMPIMAGESSDLKPSQAAVQPSPLSAKEQKEYEFIRQRMMEQHELLDGVARMLGDQTGEKGRKEGIKVLERLAAFGDPQQLPKLAATGGIAAFKKDLVTLLKNPDPVVRGSSALMLAIIGDPAYNADIAKLLADKPGPVPGNNYFYNSDRGYAAYAMGVLGGKKYAPRLVELLQSKDEKDRAWAIAGLGKMGDKTYATTIAKRLEDEDEGNLVKAAAISALAELGADEYVKDIANSFDELSLDAKPMACYALAKLKATVQAGKIAVLLKDDLCAGDAAKALALMGAKEYVNDIAALLENERLQTRGDALTALGILGAKEHAPAVAAHLQDKEPLIRFFAVTALLLMGDRTHDAEIVKTMYKLSDSGKPEINELYFRQRLEIHPLFVERHRQLVARLAQEWEQITREVKVPQPGVPTNKSQPKGNGSEAK